MWKLYNGEVTLTMDARHIYRVVDEKHGIAKPKPVINVTSVLGIIDKSRGLLPWAVGLAVAEFEAHVKPGVALDEIQIQTIGNAMKVAHTVKKEQAATIGSIVHKYAEDRLGLEDVDLPTAEAARSGAEAFDGWLEQHDIRPLHVEKKLYSRKYGYAGTVDFVGLIDGKMFVADFKTSNSIYPEMQLQTAAYAMALREEYPDLKIDARAIIRFSKEDGSFEFCELPNQQVRDELAFLSALSLHQWNKAASSEIYAIKKAMAA